MMNLPYREENKSLLIYMNFQEHSPGKLKFEYHHRKALPDIVWNFYKTRSFFMKSGLIS
jgi:hypothetical protein